MKQKMLFFTLLCAQSLCLTTAMPMNDKADYDEEDVIIGEESDSLDDSDTPGSSEELDSVNSISSGSSSPEGSSGTRTPTHVSDYNAPNIIMHSEPMRHKIIHDSNEAGVVFRPKKHQSFTPNNKPVQKKQLSPQQKIKNEITQAITEDNAKNLLHVLQGNQDYINAPLDEAGTTPLILAAKLNKYHTAELLLAGIKIEQQKPKKTFSLFKEKPRTPLVLKANIEATDLAGKTALHYAAQHKDGLEIVKRLLVYGANPLAEDMSGYTALRLAVYMKNPLIIEYLSLKAPKLMFLHSRDGYTPLHDCAGHAYKDGFFKLIKIMQEYDPQSVARKKQQLTTIINLLSTTGESLLCTLANDDRKFEMRPKMLEIASYLIENDIDALAAEKNGKTALHFAAQRGHLELIELLLSKLPQKTITLLKRMKDSKELAALDYAEAQLKIFQEDLMSSENKGSVTNLVLENKKKNVSIYKKIVELLQE